MFPVASQRKVLDRDQLLWNSPALQEKAQHLRDWQDNCRTSWRITGAKQNLKRKRKKKKKKKKKREGRAREKNVWQEPVVWVRQDGGPLGYFCLCFWRPLHLAVFMGLTWLSTQVHPLGSHWKTCHLPLSSGFIWFTPGSSSFESPMHFLQLNGNNWIQIRPREHLQLFTALAPPSNLWSEWLGWPDSVTELLQALTSTAASFPGPRRGGQF